MANLPAAEAGEGIAAVNLAVALEEASVACSVSVLDEGALPRRGIRGNRTPS